mmetsp:Transcript_167135/g.536820  ORF Transcript_167135/g.536820 Transcript_167135/m.536820 type:complete len:257 (+) Transcript_167135:83-853(+)
MPGKWASTGCFPGQTAVRSVSQADLLKLTYGTSYKTGVSGKVHREDDRWENFIDIHDIGKKDTKYLKYQKKTAPLLDRSACTHRRDFTQLPLGDYVANNLLAKEFAAGLAGGPGGLPVSVKNSSAYKEEFAGFAPDRAKAAKGKSFAPKGARTATITGMTDLLETRPLSHVSFGKHDASLAKPAEIHRMKPSLGLVDWQGKVPKSSYGHEFCGLKSASVPQIGQLGGPEDIRPAVLLPDDHPAFKMKRMCFMSPGQ